ncbi:YeeE/YedE family protein [Celerinatantimonas diazotrophica]|uniref:Sulphur transport domain-containing protein n=1 Tax=Celerinatantimonas diazotrophica TaxID=412034 RepID=A0A4R1KGW0_9GAMM|nr:YeeE/YedE family protein [Celerinatantimonas diazotrophica]TCK63952.1 hypothetical protein EV690_0066 [Celerinatantimonas diazotrophica]CAG9297037.1 hypothetical protein CEDIAZO_02199 [Celerinatantimonas diazotrophica]
MIIVAWIAGLLFGIGLVVSDMVNPTRVIGFLHVTSHWDPTLIFVMVGAIIVFAAGYWLVIKRRQKSILGQKYELSAYRKIDAPLVFGAAIFGIGWGLVGICPGPALTSLTSGAWPLGLFVIAMLAGMYFIEKVKSR